MKKIWILLILLSMGLATVGQQPVKIKYDKEYYLNKSRSKKTTAWILLGAGTAAAIAGGIGFNQTFCIFCNDNRAGAYGALFVAGAVADLVSIPFFVSAHHFQKMAAEVTITNQNTYFPKTNIITMNNLPSITVRVNF